MPLQALVAVREPRLLATKPMPLGAYASRGRQRSFWRQLFFRDGVQPDMHAIEESSIGIDFEMGQRRTSEEKRAKHDVDMNGRAVETDQGISW